jgi:urea transport system substrate-binding protein
MSVDCPDPERLRELAAGTLPADAAASLRAHVLGCDRCAAAFGAWVETCELTPGTAFDFRTRPGPTFDYLHPPELPGELGRLGPYRVCRLLGSGGTGDVFEAEDVLLGRRAALKVLRPDRAREPRHRRRFLQEARSLAGVRHPNVVAVYQVGEADSARGEPLPFLAMECLAGETLEARLQREGRLPLADALAVARAVAEGLAGVHDAGLVHRDVKPANIFLCRGERDSGDRPTDSRPLGAAVRLLDFGLARAAEPGVVDRLTEAGTVLGTPAYLSPEQARGRPLDGRSDLFALGVVLFRACSGRLPFEGSDTLSLLTALAVDEPPALDKIAPDVPPSLCALLAELLAKDPALRPTDARTVADRLDAIACGETAAPPRRPTRRGWLAGGAAALVAITAGTAGLGWWLRGGRSAPMADSERPVIDATLLAVHQLNARGGLLGRQVEAIVADGASDAAVFARRAEWLLGEGAAVVFGCWTSASRKTVLPVFERYEGLLVYPVQYEGLEQSPFVLYTGAAPNQQILPAVRWAVSPGGRLRRKRPFLVGSDYVFPRTADAIIGDALLDYPDVHIAGRAYLPLGSTDFDAVARRVKDSGADLVLNTVNGDGNRSLFRALRRAGVRSDEVPTVSFSVGESELRGLDEADVIGDYAAWNYFDAIDTPENRAFVRFFRAAYGEGRAVSDPMEAAWVGVHLWAEGVRRAGTPKATAVREAVRGLHFAAPGGPVRVDPATGHLWKVFRVGQIVAGKHFRVERGDLTPLPPKPFPVSRPREAWERFLRDLNEQWDGRWEAPAGGPRPAG